MTYNNAQMHRGNGNSFRTYLPADVRAHSIGKIDGKRLVQLTQLIDDMLMTQLGWMLIGSYDERIRGPFLQPLKANFELHDSPYGLGYLPHGANISKIQPSGVNGGQATEYDIGRFLAVAANAIPQSRLVLPLTDKERGIVDTITLQNEDLVVRILDEIRAKTVTMH